MITKRRILEAFLVGGIVFLAFFNLHNFPLTWFDEGSHLHVPKTLVRFGEYADYSSDGFRYYGPTIGVGPTVMLPIAGMFYVLGIGLLQARLIIAVYLLFTLLMFYRLAAGFGDWKYALLALAFVISSRSILLLEIGRQVLGEVPGLFFVLSAFVVWFGQWKNPSIRRLILAGSLLGLAAITKYQYLLFIAPTLLLAWVANLIYYRSAPQRNFIIPGVTALVLFAAWQAYLLIYLGPATIGENFSLLRESAASAAFNFSPSLIDQNLGQLISRSAFLGALLPALFYGFTLILPRQEHGQKWGILYFLVFFNLVWYTGFSIGWLRYAFIGFAFSAFFVAKLFYDLTAGLQIPWKKIVKGVLHHEVLTRDLMISSAFGVWCVLIFIIPMMKNVKDILLPPQNTPILAANYLQENIPENAVIETWEPELGFLTNHNYHFPPTGLLTKAIDHVYFNGPPVSEFYVTYKNNPPDYIIVGQFSAWVEIYDYDFLASNYALIEQIGAYQIYSKIR